MFSLGGVIGGAFLSWHLGPALSSWYLEKWAGNPSIVLVISMALLFILVVVIATLACRMVQIFLRWSALSFIDRILGGMAGALKGVFLVLFLYAVLMAFSSFISPQWFKQSIAMKLASQAWPYVNTFLYSAEGITYPMKVRKEVWNLLEIDKILSILLNHYAAIWLISSHSYNSL